MNIKQPEPGTELPVVVHEWSDEETKYEVGYKFDGHGFMSQDGVTMPSIATRFTFALLGLPLSIKAKAVVE